MDKQLCARGGDTATAWGCSALWGGGGCLGGVEGVWGGLSGWGGVLWWVPPGCDSHEAADEVVAEQSDGVGAVLSAERRFWSAARIP